MLGTFLDWNNGLQDYIFPIVYYFTFIINKNGLQDYIFTIVYYVFFFFLKTDIKIISLRLCIMLLF